MCLHFRLVATNMMDIVSFAKHLVFISVGQDQKFFRSPSCLSCQLIEQLGV